MNKTVWQQMFISAYFTCANYLAIVFPPKIRRVSAPSQLLALWIPQPASHRFAECCILLFPVFHSLIFCHLNINTLYCSLYQIEPTLPAVLVHFGVLLFL